MRLAKPIRLILSVIIAILGVIWVGLPGERRVVSRTKRVVDLTSRIWRSITTTNMFSQLLDITLSIYK
jgi:hypothetical protein